MYSNYKKELTELLSKLEGQELEDFLQKAIYALHKALKAGGKVLLAGNGGSAADASHFAAEFTGRYKMERTGLPFICLSSDSSFLTAWSNDYDFSTVFSRQVEAYGTEGDILILISTSGKSKNLILAAEEAKKRGVKVVSFLGKGGGELASLSDIFFIVPSDNTPRIQEIHIHLIHIISEELEKILA